MNILLLFLHSIIFYPMKRLLTRVNYFLYLVLNIITSTYAPKTLNNTYLDQNVKMDSTTELIMITGKVHTYFQHLGSNFSEKYLFTLFRPHGKRLVIFYFKATEPLWKKLLKINFLEKLNELVLSQWASSISYPVYWYSTTSPIFALSNHTTFN